MLGLYQLSCQEFERATLPNSLLYTIALPSVVVQVCYWPVPPRIMGLAKYYGWGPGQAVSFSPGPTAQR